MSGGPVVSRVSIDNWDPFTLRRALERRRDRARAERPRRHAAGLSGRLSVDGTGPGLSGRDVTRPAERAAERAAERPAERAAERAAERPAERRRDRARAERPTRHAAGLSGRLSGRLSVDGTAAGLSGRDVTRPAERAAERAAERPAERRRTRGRIAASHRVFTGPAVRPRGPVMVPELQKHAYQTRIASILCPDTRCRCSFSGNVVGLRQTRARRVFIICFLQNCVAFSYAKIVRRPRGRGQSPARIRAYPRFHNPFSAKLRALSCAGRRAAGAGSGLPAFQ